MTTHKIIISWKQKWGKVLLKLSAQYSINAKLIYLKQTYEWQKNVCFKLKIEGTNKVKIKYHNEPEKGYSYFLNTVQFQK